MVNGLQLSAVSSGSFGRYECGPGNRTARENQCRKKGLVKALQGIVTDSIKRFLDPNYVNLFPKVDLQGLSWHQYKHIVAFVSAPNQVSVHDLEDSEGKDHCFLTGECQRGIKVLEWRPNGGKSLSVPCKGGICTWAASYPGNAASVRSGAASFTNKAHHSPYGTCARSGNSCSTRIRGISMLKWSPTGDYFFSTKLEQHGILVGT